ncbi:MAG: succinylglutamate desuccinylase/aspartoacylase family protein [Sphaerochaetaceae bacterium]|nr:succinylglutamate desuccinylase/aspartoacylase family protein [Sphaerochaetaceae bacterium]
MRKNRNGLFALILVCCLFVVTVSCTQDVTSRKQDDFVYRSYDEVLSCIFGIAGKYPAIIKTDIVGKSVENRDIHALYLSSQPDKLGKIPSVRLAGNIHGNEKISSEVLLRFLDYAASNYEKNPRIKKIIDENCIVVIPVINPDGYVKNSRRNANGVDLNRDFTDYSGVSAKPLFSQPESQAVRDYHREAFDCSISFHSGDVVISMLLDFAKSSVYVPKHLSLAQMLARTYAETVCTDTGKKFCDNPDIFLGTEGVIVGGDWYIVNGSLQDWSYLETGCIDMTVELSEDYAPDKKSKVDETYLYNRDAILAFIEKAGEVKNAGIDRGGYVTVTR